MEAELLKRVYASIVARETTYDGVYFTGVLTTRIVCRPSCHSRTPKMSNIRLYPSVEAAVRDGFRPCKRCRPEVPGPHGPDAALAVQVDRLLKADPGAAHTLESLADRLAVSPYHLQRTYKRVTGRSPAETLGNLRQDLAKRLLKEQPDMLVSAIGTAVGFRSAPHFSAWFKRMTGHTPQAYRGENPPEHGAAVTDTRRR